MSHLRPPRGLRSLGLCIFISAICLALSPDHARARHLSAAEVEAIPNAFPTTLLPPTNPALRPMLLRLQNVGNPMDIGKLISEVLSLGNLQVPVLVKECGTVDVGYSRKQRRILVCYEFAAEINQLLGKPREQINQIDATTAAVLVFASLHEIGHALIHTLNLPVDGPEEDVADQFAILIMLGVNDAAMARRIVQAPAAYFHHHGIEVEGKSGHDADDQHGTSEQRAREALCLLYNRYHDPEIGRVLGSAAPGCPARAARITAAWNARLAPYTRVSGGRMF